MKKPIVALTLALSVFAMTGAGAALAHECFNANRSATGNEAAGTHSQRWLTIFTEEFFTDPEIGLTPEQIEDALALAEESGFPESFTIFIGNHTIAEGTPAMEERGHASNGRGIDHLFDAYFDDFLGIVCKVAPDNPICEGPPPEE